jgi:CheY-like chemotaxis protein
VGELSVLWVGDGQRNEFCDARAALEEFAIVVGADDVAAAMAAAEERQPADLIVVAQAYPGQFSPGAIDELRRLYPLAPVIGLLGNWCEGEGRSGRPWPGAVRVYWHQWRPRCSLELDRMRQGRLSGWSLPPTATDEERLLGTPAAAVAPGHGTLAVSSDSFEMQDWLASVGRRLGYRTHWLRPGDVQPPEETTVALFDGGDGGDRDGRALERLAAAIRPAPVIAILGFPRLEDRDRALAAGAVAMVSKPLLIDDLVWQIGFSVGVVKAPL